MADKLNILFPVFFNHMRAGGVSRYLLTLVSYLEHTNNFDFHGKFQRTDIKLKKRNPWNIFYRRVLFLKSIIFLNIYIKKKKIDIVHLNPSLTKNAMLREYLIFKKLKGNVKTLVFFHGWDYNNEYLFQKYPKLKGFFEADYIIVLSKAIKSRLISFGIHPDKIRLSRTMVEDSFTKIRFQSKNFENKIELLFLSRIEKAKGIYELLDAYIILKIKYKQNISLTIAGNGSEINNVKNYVLKKLIKDVNFVGFVDGNQKIELLKNSSIYILPSYTEGMPISILEAMTVGLPIITTKVGGLPDFFEPGKAGFFVEVNNVEEIYNCTVKLIENKTLYSSISKNNITLARERFTPKIVSQEIERIYYELSKN